MADKRTYAHMLAFYFHPRPENTTVSAWDTFRGYQSCLGYESEVHAVECNTRVQPETLMWMEKA